MEALTYKKAGVDIEAGNEAVRRIKKHVKSTFNKDVLLGIGSFGGAISAKKLKKLKEPLLVSSIDGVGTKLKIAAMMGKWDSVGKDIVNHSANDILCQGAEPLFFLDYIAVDKMRPEQIEEIVKGMSEACREAGIPLIGGETAEMPGVYLKGETDIAGTIVGLVEKEKIISGKNIKEGDLLVALPSNGLHTNGYSLARKIFFDLHKKSVQEYVQKLGCTLGEELLKPHKCYTKQVRAVMKKFKLKGIAHITGGGLEENIVRIIPKGLSARIEKKKIRVLPIFELIQGLGNVPEKDMFRTFNMGVGIVLVVGKKDAGKIIAKLKKEFKEDAYLIGGISKGSGVEII